MHWHAIILTSRNSEILACSFVETLVQVIKLDWSTMGIFSISISNIDDKHKQKIFNYYKIFLGRKNVVGV
jgi:hypothetical protein